jgi:hypothetical protein
MNWQFIKYHNQAEKKKIFVPNFTKHYAKFDKVYLLSLRYNENVERHKKKKILK